MLEINSIAVKSIILSDKRERGAGIWKKPMILTKKY